MSVEDLEQIVIEIEELKRRTENLEAVDSERVYSRSITTTDATVTTIYSFLTESDVAYLFSVAVVAIRTDVVANTGHYFRVFRAENIGGTVTVLEMQQVGTGNVMEWLREDDSSWALTRAASGANVLIRVTGAASQTIKWTMRATVMQVPA